MRLRCTGEHDHAVVHQEAGLPMHW